MNKDDRTELKRLMVQMMRVSSWTQPVVSFDVCRMNSTGKHPKVKMLFEANKLLPELKHSSHPGYDDKLNPAARHLIERF